MKELVQNIISEIQEQYFEDDNNRPWIVGFSGGKDSTMLLQLVWYALKEYPAELRKRKIHVVCNNTLVENPKILEYTEKVLDKIQRSAVEKSMPITVNRTTPKLEDTFWVNLIGKGYPAPNNIFRWCTERMKINPTTKFILEKINEDGEVIILLGTRSDESSKRAGSIKKHNIEGQRLRKHVLPNAYVFAPIKDVLTKEVWEYLMAFPSPWGSSNRDLITLYRNASGGDCPLVIDTTTPSCGNSRFGCWVCTVVNKDKSMEALIDNGESWMEPLSELRDLLAVSRDDENSREKRRRDGTIKEGTLGPYTGLFRAHFLEQLLIAQKEIQSLQPETSLINYQELVAIQVIWFRDNLFNNSVADIYHRVYGKKINLNTGNQGLVKEKELLKEACKEHPEDFDRINKLLEIQKTKTILMNNRGLHTVIENHLEQFIKENNQ
jgi:DNA sulfur modification protein DndC